MPEVVGFVSGVFDLFHLGHLETLRTAATDCDQLVVGVVSDEAVAVAQGAPPIVPSIERREIVGAVRGVRTVVELPVTELGALPDLTDFLREHGVEVMFVGGEDHATVTVDDSTEAALDDAGIRLVRLPRPAGTTSMLIRSALSDAADRSSVA